jgi:hypothetical protein
MEAGLFIFVTAGAGYSGTSTRYSRIQSTRTTLWSWLH